MSITDNHEFYDNHEISRYVFFFEISLTIFRNLSLSADTYNLLVASLQLFLLSNIASSDSCLLFRFRWQSSQNNILHIRYNSSVQEVSEPQYLRFFTFMCYGRDLIGYILVKIPFIFKVRNIILSWNLLTARED